MWEKWSGPGQAHQPPQTRPMDLTCHSLSPFGGHTTRKDDKEDQPSGGETTWMNTRVKFWTSVQLGVMLTEKYNRQILIFIDVVLNRKSFPLCNLKRIWNIFIFRHPIAVSIMMSQVGHNVHNVTHMLLIITKKAQLIDIVRWLCNLGILWDIQYHSHLGEEIYAFHTMWLFLRIFCFAYYTTTFQIRCSIK